MKRMGRKGKSVFACMLSLAMFAQCLSASAVSVGADETAPVTEEKVTDEANGTSLPKDKDTEVTTQKKTADQPTTVKAKKAGLTAPVNPAKVSGSVQTTEGGQKTETTYVKGVEFNVVSDGSAPFNEASGRGNDQNGNNGIIRSFDQMTYRITTSYQAEPGVSVNNKNLYYAITLPNNDNLEPNDSSNLFDTSVNDDNKTYTFKFPISTQSGGAQESGETERDFVFNVLNMHEGQTFQPSVRCWFDGNPENTKPDGTKALHINGQQDANYAQASVTRVTSAPAYNVILEKGGNAGIDTFEFGSENSKNFLSDSNTTYEAAGYTGNKIKGYAVTWGIAVEMRKTNASESIRGVEFPDPNKDLSFDVDLYGTYTPTGGSTISTQNRWAPVLYRVRENSITTDDHIFSGKIPGSRQSDTTNQNNTCLNSGYYTVTQNGNKLHFVIKGYTADRTRFPKTSLDGSASYYTEIQKILEGVFTSAQFTVVYPMINNNNEDIQDKLGESGNYSFKAKASELKATSVENILSNEETVLTDNESEDSVNVIGGHGRLQEIYFSSVDNATEGSDFDKSSNAASMNNKSNDSDSARSGSTVYFTTTWSEDNASTAYPVEGRTVAADQLVLVEGDAIKIEQANWRNNNVESHGYKLYPLYVGAENALTFEQTKTLMMTDDSLSYYDSPEAVKNAGKHIVGVLLRWRGISYSINEKGQSDNVNGALLIAQTRCQIPDNAVSDKVYSITVQSKLYDTSILPDVENQEFDSDNDRADAYRNAARRNLLGNGPLCVTNSSLNPENNGTLDSRSVYTTQPTYDENGYHPGGGVTLNKKTNTYQFGRDHADSLYIVPYYTQITKTVAQQDKNQNQKNTYDLDKKEEYVDYKLTGSMSFMQSASYNEGSQKTTITIKDEIPDGLSYVDGSAVWNPSSYKEVEGGTSKGEIAGGTLVTPSQDKHQDGSVTLTWTISNVTVVNGTLPALYYSCKINTDEQNGTSLNNTATIHSSEEKRAICPANKNISDAGIQITRASGFNIEKTGIQDLELNDKASFTLKASNALSTPKKNLLLVDAMPFDQKNGTVKTGVYTISNVSIADAKGNKGTKDISLYYTDDKQYAGLNDINLVSIDTVKTKWHSAKNISKQSGEGTSWEVSGWPTAIAIIDDTLGANDTITVTIGYDAKPAGAKDKLVNYLLTQGAANSTLTAHADVVVYDRSLSGTVWIDDNFNGLMDDKEERVPGVKVQLQRKGADGTWENVTSYKDTEGKTCDGTQYTNDKGYYEFTRLPAGEEYKVVFVSGDQKDSPKASDLSQYYMTGKRAGDNAAINSKTDAVKKNASGKLAEGDITGISMPTIETMKKNGQQHYNLPDQNMGLYRFKRSLEGTAWFDDNKDGAKNDKDSFEKDITVNLYHEDANGKLTKVGSTQTDKNGHYEFKNLDGGDYCVEFVNKKHSTITSTESTDGKMTSIAVETEDEKGNPIGSRIEKIHMPTDAEMLEKKESTYNKPHLDAGFISEKAAPKPSEKPNKPTDTPENPNKPDKPVKPEEPTTPENPVIPENPEKPVVPENPSKPEEPVKPAKPSNPSGTPKTTPKEPTKKPGKKTDTPKTTPKVTKTPVPSEPTEKPGKKTDTPKTTPKTTGTPEKPAPSATHHSHYSYVINHHVSLNNDTTVSSRDDTSVQHTTTGTAPVKTGDHTHAELYLALVILAGAFITGKARKSRKARHK